MYAELCVFKEEDKNLAAHLTIFKGKGEAEATTERLSRAGRHGLHLPPTFSLVHYLMMWLHVEQQGGDHADSLLPADVSLGEKTRTS